MTMIWGQRALLRAGYLVVIAVLVLSAIEAYRIQVSVSRQHLEIYLHYVDQEEVLSILRRNLWLAGNYVRDFFISVSPERSEILRSQLETLKNENQQAPEHLARTADGTAVVPNLRKSLADCRASSRRDWQATTLVNHDQICRNHWCAKVLSVPHEEIMRRETEYKGQCSLNPHRRGPKAKVKPSAS